MTYNLTRWSRRYLAASGIWLICVQAVLSVMLFRERLCQDCIDDEGLVGLDRWLLGLSPWFCLAFLGLAACGLALLVITIVRRLREHQSVPASATLGAGIACLLLGVASFVWLSAREGALTLADKVTIVASVGVLDLVALTLVAVIARQLRRHAEPLRH